MLTLGIQTPQSKVPAFKLINLSVALETTSGPVVLEDHCLGMGNGGLCWSDTLSCPSLILFPHTLTHWTE